MTANHTRGTQTSSTAMTNRTGLNELLFLFNRISLLARMSASSLPSFKWGTITVKPPVIKAKFFAA
jgi:hypothetical protein